MVAECYIIKIATVKAETNGSSISTKISIKFTKTIRIPKHNYYIYEIMYIAAINIISCTNIQPSLHTNQGHSGSHVLAWMIQTHWA